MDENKINGSQEHKLTPELEAAVQKDKESREKLAEIFAQCWDDADFKKRFFEEPIAVMKEFGVDCDETKDYKVLDSEPKSLYIVLPFEGIKPTMEAVGKSFIGSVSDVTEVKQIIPEGWKLCFIQNTESTNYIVLPVSPETLTPEELEFVNGGAFFIAVTVFLFTALAVVSVAAAAVAVVAAAAVVAVAAAGEAVVAVQAALLLHLAVAGVTVTQIAGTWKEFVEI